MRHGRSGVLGLIVQLLVVVAPKQENVSALMESPDLMDAKVTMLIQFHATQLPVPDMEIGLSGLDVLSLVASVREQEEESVLEVRRVCLDVLETQKKLDRAMEM